MAGWSLRHVQTTLFVNNSSGPTFSFHARLVGASLLDTPAQLLSHQESRDANG